MRRTPGASSSSSGRSRPSWRPCRRRQHPLPRRRHQRRQQSSRRRSLLMAFYLGRCGPACKRRGAGLAAGQGSASGDPGVTASSSSTRLPSPTARRRGRPRRQPPLRPSCRPLGRRRPPRQLAARLAARLRVGRALGSALAGVGLEPRLALGLGLIAERPLGLPVRRDRRVEVVEDRFAQELERLGDE